MFTLLWYDGSRGEAVCADSVSAWNIYWALKEQAKHNGTPYEDKWIIIYCGGIPCNPERGNGLLPCRDGEGPRFLLMKGREKDG